MGDYYILFETWKTKEQGMSEVTLFRIGGRFVDAHEITEALILEGRDITNGLFRAVMMVLVMESAARTMEALLLNGDPSTPGSNMNLTYPTG